MSEEEWESGEEDIDETGRNPTQQRMDEELGDADVDNEPTPHAGEEGQDLI